MKETNLPGPPAAEPNGAPASRARPRKGSKPRSATDSGAVSPAAAQPLAPFGGLETAAVDAEMWPAHPMVWLQPELRPGVPATSGLRIERHHKVPIPDFVYFDVVPSCPPPALDAAGGLLPPNLPQPVPRSALVPLGWDPRVALDSRKGSDQ